PLCHLVSLPLPRLWEDLRNVTPPKVSLF
nr:T cell receptor beta2 [Mus musculus]